MEEKLDNGSLDDREKENIDYYNLINDFTSKDDSSDETTPNLDNIALTELVGGEIEAKSDDAASPEAGDGMGENELSSIFDDFDELSRDGVIEEETAEPEKQDGQEEITPEISMDEKLGTTEIVLDDNDGDGYASVLSQFDGEKQENPPSEALTGEFTVEKDDESVVEDRAANPAEALTGQYPVETSESIDENEEDEEVKISQEVGTVLSIIRISNIEHSKRAKGNE